jgi:hypothetical protein
MAAAGIRAHGISVPPPTQMADICPRAVSVAAPPPIAVANRLATEPARDIPEKPEPSRPVIAPMVVKLTAAISFDRGTAAARSIPRSLTIPLDVSGR